MWRGRVRVEVVAGAEWVKGWGGGQMDAAMVTGSDPGAGWCGRGGWWGVGNVRSLRVRYSDNLRLGVEEQYIMPR